MPKFNGVRSRKRNSNKYFPTKLGEKMKKLIFIASLVTLPLSLSGCMSAGDHRNAVSDENQGKLTVGTVQREIKKGMSSAEVAQILGAPNIVTTDQSRNEVWVYDKISTTAAYSTSSGGVGSLILGAASSVGGLVGGSYNSSAGANSTNQKTLTIIIKFDENHLVRDYSYNTSSF